MMNRRYIGKPRSKIVFIALIAVLVGSFLFSCRSRVSNEAIPSAGIEALETEAPGELVVTASLLAGRERIEKRFKTYLPDSGIVPVEVTLENNTDQTVVLRATNGLALPEIYSGFILEYQGKRFMLLSPFEALMLIMAEGKSLAYRKPGVFDAVVGIAFPPSLFYYGYKEYAIGRLYRSLFKNSLYQARKSGVLEPLRIGPGEEAKGFLYFFVLPEDSPYPTEYNDREEGVGLHGGPSVMFVQPTYPFETEPSGLEVRDAVAARVENASLENKDIVDRERALFALGSSGKWERGDVLMSNLKDALHRDGGSFIKVSTYSSNKSRLADASMHGAHAACLLNFKSSSMICIADLNADGDGAMDYDLERRAVRVILMDDGFISMAEDGECRFTRFGDKLTSRRVRLGKESQDLFLDGDRLVLLSKKGVSFLGASNKDLLEKYENLPLAEGRRRFIGRDAKSFYVMHEADKVGGDTLAVYDPETFYERWRISLPGKIEHIDMEKGFLVQIEDGTILHMSRDEAADTLRLDSMGYVPVPAGAIVHLDDGFTVIGKNGLIAEGGQVPRLIEELVKRVPVTVEESTPNSSRPR
jgi:hypothetical protein